MQSLKTRPGRGGKKSQNQNMSQDSYRRSSTTWSARKRFQEDHEHLCKTRHFIVVIEQHLLLQMLQTAAAQEDGAPCCIYKLCRCNYRHYSKTNQMLEFHQNQSRNSLYLTAWNYLSDKDKQHKHDAEVHFSDSKFENVKLSSLIGHIPHSAESRIISCIF